MIILGSTDTISVVLTATVSTYQLDCFSSYRDITTTSITPGRGATFTNNLSVVNVISSPEASTQRVIDYISIYNKDSNNSVITLYFNNNGTLFELFKTNLSANEKVEYQEGSGFKVFSNSGGVKSSINQGVTTTSSGLSCVVLQSDVTNSNAIANTMVDVTGLSFPVLSNQRYYFKFIIINYTSAATTTGSRWSINGALFSDLIYYSKYSLTATTETTNHGVVAYNLPAGCNATSASITGNIAIIEGYITPSENGVVTARFASEVANSAVIARAGSLVYFQSII